MHELSGPVVHFAKAALFKRAAQEQVRALPVSPSPAFDTDRRVQGGLLSGKDPSEFNSADPLRLWIIQVGVFVVPLAKGTSTNII